LKIFLVFSHRGLLIDTSRHFIPIDSILRIIDSLSYNKMNVLHWHIVDAESFPIESKTYPNLQKGAYSNNMIYKQEDVKNIIKYAYKRGIRIIPEFDTPGHTYSWGIGYPSIITNCPKYSKNINNVPLNIAGNTLTFELINGLFTEMSQLFIDNFFHIGGEKKNFFFFFIIIIIR